MKKHAARSAEAASNLSDVFRSEAAAISARRSKLRLDQAAPPTGIALSGGGIRSATFCLGFLQALADHRLLGRFDYLSTVSGGGYVGGWWSGWLSRPARDGDKAGAASVGDPAPRLFPEDESIDPGQAGASSPSLAGADPIKFLRLFSNYLTPRKGLFSADVWRAVAVTTRNLVLNWLALLPLLFAGLCLVQVPLALQLAKADERLRASSWSARAEAVESTFAVFGGAIAVLLVSATTAWLIVSAKFGSGSADGRPSSRISFGRIIAASVGQGLFLALILIHPAVSTRIGWPWGLDNAETQSMLRTWAATSVALLLPYLALNYVGGLRNRKDSALNLFVRIHARTLIVGVAVAVPLAASAFGDLAWKSTVLAGGWGVNHLAGLAGVALSLLSAAHTAVNAAPTGGADVRMGQHVRSPNKLLLSISPFLVVLLLGAIGAWLARYAFESVAVSELPARTSASYDWLMIGAMAGNVLCLIIALTQLDGPPVTLPLVAFLVMTWQLRNKLQTFPRVLVLWVIALHAVVFAVGLLLNRRVGSVRVRPWALSAAALVAALLVGSIFAAKGTPLLSALLFVDLDPRATHVRDAITVVLMGLVVAAVFLLRRKPCLGALCLVAVPGFIVGGLAVLNFLPVTDHPWAPAASVLLGLGGTALTAALALGWVVDPNLISLHQFYRARIVRAYLGASNCCRGVKATEVTDAVKGDDLSLADVCNVSVGAPYPLINTTLNLVAARDLGVIQRRSANFLLSPLFCGSTRTGYRTTQSYMGGAMTLGTALAISGAAASPAMGTVRLTAAQAMLLTLLNIRLGFWAPNPAKSSWNSPQARLWTFFTLLEFLSQTDENSAYCYLTDGGHFDNTGLYTLVQRACQTILVVDCGHDPRPPALSDLGHAVRICRIDFGAEIELDIDALATAPPPAFIVGDIRYSKQHLAELDIKDSSRARGKIIWVKPSIWKEGEIASDVRQYARAYGEFPQQGTGDLWYDEAQFESYRKLGACAAVAALPALKRSLPGVSSLVPLQGEGA